MKNYKKHILVNISGVKSTNVINYLNFLIELILIGIKV